MTHEECLECVHARARYRYRADSRKLIVERIECALHAFIDVNPIIDCRQYEESRHK